MIFVVAFSLFFAGIAGQEYYQYGSRRNGCCGYASRVIAVGQDTFDRNVHVNVGRCSSSCNFDSVYTYQSVLQRILEKKIKKKIHFSHSQCTPLKTRVDNVLLRDGVRQVDVIESCAFRKPVKTCTRVAMFMKFFSGTEFETTVDVGECQGGCRSLQYGKTCKSDEISMISVQGPNGVLLINTIVKCRCEQACYRQHFKVEVKESVVSPNGQTTIRPKIIDIGRCAGSCSPIKKCVMKSQDLKDGSEPSCLMALETNDVTCSPTRSRTISFVNEHNEISRLRQVKRCGCV